MPTIAVFIFTVSLIHINCTSGNCFYNGVLLFQDLYHLDLNYDPEGVLGSLNSIVLCFLGVQAGKTLLQFRGKNFAIFIRFLVWGLALVSNLR